MHTNVDKLIYENTKGSALNSRPESAIGLFIFFPDQKLWGTNK